MIDFHSHILPCVDDGAATVEESVSMLCTLKRAGFDTVILSPHFYSNKESAADFLKRRDGAFALLIKATEGKDVPKLLTGAEVYLTELLFNNDDLTALTQGGSGHMLTELPYDRRFTEEMRANLERLVYNCGITPVLAHIDRYPFLTDIRLLTELFELGCLAQVNLDAFSGKRRRKIKKLVKRGMPFALGSDAHGIDGLEVRLVSDLQSMEKLCGPSFGKASARYSKEMLQC